MKEFSLLGATRYCPECTLESGTLTILHRSDDEQSAGCRQCGRTYRSRMLTLAEYDFVALLYRCVARIAPDVLREEMNYEMELAVSIVLKEDDEKAQEEEP